MTISIDAWVEAAFDKDGANLAQLINGLPPSSMQSTAASLAQNSKLEMRVQALHLVSQDHSNGGAPELGRTIAIAGIRICERAYELHGPGTAETFLFGFRWFAIDAHRAYDRMGRRADQIAIVENALAWLKARDAEERCLVDLRFARIEALIELGRLEEAREGLREGHLAPRGIDHGKPGAGSVFALGARPLVIVVHQRNGGLSRGGGRDSGEQVRKPIFHMRLSPFA